MDNEGSNFTENFTSPSSPLNNPDKSSGLSFSQGQDVQSSRVKISNFIGKSGTANPSATLGTGASATLTTQLTPIQFTNIGLKNMAIPYVAIYEGTSQAGSMQLYPKIGVNETPEKMRFYSGFDWNDWSNGSTQTSIFKVTIYNNAATAVTFNVVTQWQYIQNNGGVSQ